ncbi:MAG: hypothetical protein ACI3V5_01665 [Faecousia sp.]
MRQDAHAHGAALRFETLTCAAAQMLADMFPGEFEIEPCRDYAEYLYTREKLTQLPGPEMASKRQQHLFPGLREPHAHRKDTPGDAAAGR